MAKEKTVSKTQKLNKKNTSWIRFFLSVVVILGLGYIILNYVPFIAKYDHYVIVTNSMEPVINVGDVVIVDTSVKPEDMAVGQIIAVRADINEDGTKEVIVHYLYSVTDENGTTIYRTHPEKSPSPDPWTLTADDIVGAYVLTIPKIGPALLFAQSTIGRIIIIVDIVVIYLLFELFSKGKKEDKNKAIKAIDSDDESIPENKEETP